MAAASPFAGVYLHFDFPEGTTSITQPDKYDPDGERHDSWNEPVVKKKKGREWKKKKGVDKSKVTSVGIPWSVTRIGVNAFCGCGSLRDVVIPTSVTHIGKHAFEGCSSLASVAIPASVISIAAEAFRGCSSLTRVDIPTSVTRIEGGAFAFCV